MKSLHLSLLMSGAILFGACTAVQTGGEVASGRQAFLAGRQDAALAYFQSAANRNPNYMYGSTLRQSVLSYLGRSQYANGQYGNAKQSLEKALAANRQENLARLYLGLTLIKAGDRAGGLKEVESSMRSIHDWLEYLSDAHRFSVGKFWDPSREIRSAIEKNLAMLSSREADVNAVVANAEWLGKRLEEESDLASRDESKEMSNDSADGGDAQP